MTLSQKKGDEDKGDSFNFTKETILGQMSQSSERKTGENLFNKTLFISELNYE